MALALASTESTEDSPQSNTKNSDEDSNANANANASSAFGIQSSTGDQNQKLITFPEQNPLTASLPEAITISQQNQPAKNDSNSKDVPSAAFQTALGSNNNNLTSQTQQETNNNFVQQTTTEIEIEKEQISSASSNPLLTSNTTIHNETIATNVSASLTTISAVSCSISGPIQSTTSNDTYSNQVKSFESTTNSVSETSVDSSRINIPSNTTSNEASKQTSLSQAAQQQFTNSSSPNKTTSNNNSQSSISTISQNNKSKLTPVKGSQQQPLPVAHKRTPVPSSVPQSQAQPPQTINNTNNQSAGVNSNLVRATKSAPIPTVNSDLPSNEGTNVPATETVDSLAAQPLSTGDFTQSQLPPPETTVVKKRRKREKAKKGASDNGEPERASKRMRLQYQPFQSPESLPKIFRHSTFTAPRPQYQQGNPEDKVMVFERNDFLAVRNETNEFFVCRTVQNVYKNSRKFKIQWFNNEKRPNIYVADYYDVTDFDCILTNLRLNRLEKGEYELPPEERQRTMNILQRAINIEKGINEPVDPSKVVVDGVDVSVVGKAEEKQLIEQIKNSIKKSKEKEKLATKEKEKSSKRLLNSDRLAATATATAAAAAAATQIKSSKKKPKEKSKKLKAVKKSKVKVTNKKDKKKKDKIKNKKKAKLSNGTSTSSPSTSSTSRQQQLLQQQLQQQIVARKSQVKPVKANKKVSNKKSKLIITTTTTTKTSPKTSPVLGLKNNKKKSPKSTSKTKSR